MANKWPTNGQQMAASSERFHAPKNFPTNITRNKQPDKQTNQPLGPQPSIVWITSRLFAGYPSSCCIAYFYISDIPPNPKTWHGTNGTKQKEHCGKNMVTCGFHISFRGCAHLIAGYPVGISHGNDPEISPISTAKYFKPWWWTPVCSW